MHFRKPHPVPLVFMCLSVALFIALGVWQLQRLHWKEALLAQVQAAQSAPWLGTLPDNDTELAQDAYRNVALSGHFIGNTSLRFIGQRTGGYVLYSPFKLDDSDRVILVIRGWFPANAELAPPQENALVKGWLRAPRKERLFSPPNHPEENLWFVENIPAMRAALGADIAPTILDTTPPAPFRNDHLGYAIMWFALAIVALGMFAAYQRKA